MKMDDKIEFSAANYPNLATFEHNKTKIEGISDFLKWLKSEKIYLCTQERTQGGASWEALHYDPARLAFKSFGIDSAKSIAEVMSLLEILGDDNG